MRNYLATGKDVYLDSATTAAKNIKAILDIYKGRKDIGIVKLSEISGFEKKKNWILITDGDPEQDGSYDLIYAGNDVLDETLNVGRKNKKGDTLFAKYMTDRDAKMLMSSALRNRVGDAKKLEAGLIAVKLKESAPKSSFNRILITSTNAANQIPEAADLNKILPVLKKFADLNPKLIPENSKSLFQDNTLFDANSYRQNALEAYKHYITVHLNAREKRLLSLDFINSYEKEKDGHEQIMYRALEDAKFIEAS
jgi:hypothetical protein